MARREDAAAAQPLGARLFHILLSLADGERHGYSIGKEIDEATRGAIRLGPGTLYGLLKQMADDGWIAETEQGAGDDPRRRTYRLTARGRRVAQAESERMAGLVRVARSRKLLPAGALV